MAQSKLIAGGTIALSTTESANQVIQTYEYIDAGVLKLYAFGSAADCRINLFVNGMQLVRNQIIPFHGTTGLLDLSSHLMTMEGSLGGKVEITFIADAATPTVNFVLQYDSAPGGRILSRLFGRR